MNLGLFYYFYLLRNLFSFSHFHCIHFPPRKSNFQWLIYFISTLLPFLLFPIFMYKYSVLVELGISIFNTRDSMPWIFFQQLPFFYFLVLWYIYRYIPWNFMWNKKIYSMIGLRSRIKKFPFFSDKSIVSFLAIVVVPCAYSDCSRNKLSLDECWCVNWLLRHRWRHGWQRMDPCQHWSPLQTGMLFYIHISLALIFAAFNLNETILFRPAVYF